MRYSKRQRLQRITRGLPLNGTPRELGHRGQCAACHSGMATGETRLNLNERVADFASVQEAQDASRRHAVS
jgi:hypothetical protein